MPPFNADGLLPVGDHQLTIAQLRQSHLVTGNGRGPDVWDAAWRLRLVGNLETLIHQLWQVGIDAIFVDGSFVEEKSHPNDIDGYFECDVHRFRILEQELNLLDPYKVWTWAPASRRPDTNSAKNQLPMWHRYRVELYPHFPGVLTGIRDQFGNDQTFPAAFRVSRREFKQKGVVRIVR